MAEIYTYQVLSRQIQDYTNHKEEEFLRNIPWFISQAIERIVKESSSLGFERTIVLPIIEGQYFVDKPEDWKRTLSMSLKLNDKGRIRPLLLRSLELAQLYIGPGEFLAGGPKFYADEVSVDNLAGVSSWYLSPTSDADYELIIKYSQRVFFDESNNINFLTREYPRLLFFAAMAEAMFFLKNFESVAFFEGAYQTALIDINKETQDRHSDRVYNRGGKA